MLISLKKRFLFICNTKAASTSIEASLQHLSDVIHTGTPALKHIAYRDVLKEYQTLFTESGKTPDTLFRFGVMRDPISWISSWFRYRRGNEVQAPLPAEMSFREFWQNNDWNITRHNGTRYLQRTCFEDDFGRISMDFLIRYEELPIGFKEVMQSIGVDAVLPRLNQSNLHENADIVPADLRDELRDFYDADYEIYNKIESINAAGLARWARVKGSDG